MENLRLILFVALALIAFALWNAWQEEHPALAPQINKPARLAIESNTNSTTQYSTQTIQPVLNTPSAPVTKEVSDIAIKTDVLNVKISLKGGNIVSVNLPKYPTTLDSTSQPFSLLTNKLNDDYYVAQSALISPSGPDSSNVSAHYQADQNEYVLQKTQNSLSVILHWKNNAGLKIDKIFTFKRGDYTVNVAYKISNKGTEVWQGYLYTQLTRKKPANANAGFFQVHPYIGAAISSPQNRYQEISFKKMANEPLDTTITNGWSAMVQHYFLSAWIPNPTEAFRYYSAVNNNLYTIGMVSPLIKLAPQEEKSVNAKLYTGPEIASNLKQIAPGLDLTVSYGWLWPISVAIFWLMKKIYDFVGNWGWSIILVTVLIKLAFYHLSAKSYSSMANMRKLQPKIEAIKERFSEDKQKLSQAMMELYKTEKVNPLGGCLPVLVQIPVFFALYMVLIESVELRQAPWIGWIHDLSAKDPYYILPIIMGITMLVQQKLNPPPPDPTQAKVMMVLPIIFTFVFSQFPAGLVLYWTVNNALSILQQWYIMRQVETGRNKKSIKKKAHAS